MFARAMTILLVAAIATTGAAAQEEATAVERAPALATGWQAEEPARAHLTPEEEREARALALRFVRKFQETLDVASLVNSEMFVGDLPERIRKHPSNESFYKPFKDGVAELASDEELRRCFATLANAMFQYWALTEADKFRKKHVEGEEDCGKETPIEQLVPPEVVSVLTNDPTFGPIFTRELRENVEAGDASGGENGEMNIDSPERLRSFISLVEKATTIARKHLENLPAWRQARHHVPYFNPDLSLDESEAVSLEVEELSEDFLGMQEGEEMICAHVLMFHFDLVKVNGHLKILAVSFNDYKVRTREETEKATKLATLLTAIEDNDAEAVISMLGAGVNVNEKDEDCTSPVLRAAMSKRLEIVKLLIDWGADLNVPNKHRNSPLHYAAADGDVEMTHALLVAGADVNAPDKAGCSPLCFALIFSSSENHLKVVELLKSRGANK